MFGLGQRTPESHHELQKKKKGVKAVPAAGGQQMPLQGGAGAVHAGEVPHKTCF